MLSDRMADKVIDQGHIGTRIVWVKLAGPTCNIFFIVPYIPHKGRTQAPYASDTLAQGHPHGGKGLTKAKRHTLTASGHPHRERPAYLKRGTYGNVGYGIMIASRG